MFPNEITALIGPIILIVLLIAFPIIGAFAGWKRGLFWGGGNLAIFIAGALTYKFAGGSMATSFAPLISNILSMFGFTGVTTQEILGLTQSLIGPIIFILFFTIGDAILAINYFTWFKRVTHISRESKIKAIIREARKQKEEPKIDPKDWRVVRYNITKEDLERIGSKKHKGLYTSMGLFSLSILTLPSTVGMAQTTLYLTSSSVSRTTESTLGEVNRGIYRIVEAFNSKVSWISFYQGQPVGEDYDTLLSLARVGTQLCPDWKKADGKYYWINPSTDSTEEEEVIDETKYKNSLVIINRSIGYSMGYLITKICTVNAASAGSEALENAANALALQQCPRSINSWNKCVNPTVYDMQGLYASENIVSLLPKLIVAPTKTTIDNDTVELLTMDHVGQQNVLDQVRNGLKTGGDIDIRGHHYNITLGTTKIHLKTRCKSVLKEIMMSFYNTNGLSDEYKTKFSEAIDKFMDMFYYFSDDGE